MISATTVLPALSSFCVYAALGVLALYILQVTMNIDVHIHAYEYLVWSCVVIGTGGGVTALTRWMLPYARGSTADEFGPCLCLFLLS